VSLPRELGLEDGFADGDLGCERGDVDERLFSPLTFEGDDFLRF
jgi:hypothetical protein